MRNKQSDLEKKREENIIKRDSDGRRENLKERVMEREEQLE